MLKIFLRPLLVDFKGRKNLIGGDVLGKGKERKKEGKKTDVGNLVDPGSGNAVSNFVQNIENIGERETRRKKD